MTTIKIQERGGGTLTCCFCLDGVSVGPACPGCGARYHDECAAIVGRCVILGCREALTRGRTVASTPLPRLGILARAMGRWARLGLPEGVELGWAVVLLPSRREVKEDLAAARAVAEQLGPEHTAYDGRLRLQSPHPEPLGRVDDQAAATAALNRLRGEGISALALPMRELLAPIDARAVVEVTADPLGMVAKDAAGAETDLAFADPRLVVLGSVVTVERKAVTRRQGHMEASRHGARYVATKTSLFPQERRSSEPCLHVFRRGAPPLFFRRNALRSWGPGLRPPPTSIQPWYKLTEDLKQDATVIEVHATGSPALLSFEPGDTDTQSNLLGAHLVARIWAAAWASDQLTPPRPRLKAPPGTSSFQVRGVKGP